MTLDYISSASVNPAPSERPVDAATCDANTHAAHGSHHAAATASLTDSPVLSGTRHRNVRRLRAAAAHCRPSQGGDLSLELRNALPQPPVFLQ